MMEIMIREASTVDLKDLVLKFIPEVIGKEIEKACNSIYPLQNVFVHKAKTLKFPKFDGKFSFIFIFILIFFLEKKIFKIILIQTLILSFFFLF